MIIVHPFFFEKNIDMKTQYNTLVFEFEYYDELDDYIVVDDEYKKLYRNTSYFINYKIVKVWKNGKITNNNDKELKIVTIKGEEDQKDERYWKYGRSKYDKVEVKIIIWNIYSEKFILKKSILTGSEFNGIYYKDGNFNNLRLDNLIKYKETNNETEVYVNTNNYFDFNLIIPNDDDEFIQCDEPVILDHLPYFEIYKNGKIVDTRGKSEVLLNKNGYQTISYKKNYFVHRLVAISYLKNKNNYDLVNHLDGNRSNNNVNNLEWVNNTINTLHGQLTNVISYKSRICEGSRKNLYKNRLNYGVIALTSNNYRKFIKSRILMELEIDVELWIFSNKSPLFLIFLPFHEEFGQSRFEGLGFFTDNYKYLIEKIKESVFTGENKISDLNCENVDDLWLVVESINRYLVPVSQDDHIIHILNTLKIDFDKYIDWVFDNIKLFFDHDVGFIYFEEFQNYQSLLKMSEKEIYINNILIYNLQYVDFKYIRNEKSRDISEYDKKYRMMIDYVGQCHRVTEYVQSYGRFLSDNTKLNSDTSMESNVDFVLGWWGFWKIKILNPGIK